MDKSDGWKKTTSFFAGMGLIACGVADAAFNPFAFATAPQLFTAGGGLVMVSLGMRPE